MDFVEIVARAFANESTTFLDIEKHFTTVFRGQIYHDVSMAYNAHRANVSNVTPSHLALGVAPQPIHQTGFGKILELRGGPNLLAWLNHEV